jgi:hypothetical protein
MVMRHVIRGSRRNGQKTTVGHEIVAKLLKGYTYLQSNGIKPVNWILKQTDFLIWIFQAFRELSVSLFSFS